MGYKESIGRGGSARHKEPWWNIRNSWSTSSSISNETL